MSKGLSFPLALNCEPDLIEGTAAHNLLKEIFEFDDETI